MSNDKKESEDIQKRDSLEVKEDKKVEKDKPKEEKVKKEKPKNDKVKKEVPKEDKPKKEKAKKEVPKEEKVEKDNPKKDKQEPEKDDFGKVIERIRLGLGTKQARIALVCVMLVCVGFIVGDYVRKQQKQKIVDDVKEEAIEVEVEEEEEPERIISVDFEKLKALNPDIYAWLYVPGTNVNYPVLQSPEGQDTDYYLNTNIDGSYGLPGCIYTQLRNAKDFSNPDTIVYGHEMRNGTMFKTLHNFEDPEFFNTNQYIYVYTENQALVYRVFAAITYDDRLILDYYSDFTDPNVFAEYLTTIPNYPGNIDQSVEVTAEDKIITLSTCVGSSSDQRFLVIGKLLSEEEVKALDEQNVKNADDGAGAGQTELTGDDAAEEGAESTEEGAEENTEESTESSEGGAEENTEESTESSEGGTE